MMLVALALTLASTQTCKDIKQECRVCPPDGDKRGCANIGIACQPSIRICQPKGSAKPSGRPKPKTQYGG